MSTLVVAKFAPIRPECALGIYTTLNSEKLQIKSYLLRKYICFDLEVCTYFTDSGHSENAIGNFECSGKEG